MSADRGVDAIRGMARGYLMTAILRTALELHVFDALADGPVAAVRVAATTESDPRAMRVMLDALTAVGLVRRDGDQYLPSPTARRVLVRGSSEYVGETLQALTTETLWDAMKNLPLAVRSGGAVTTDADTPDHPYWTDLATGLADDSDRQAARLADLLHPWVSARRSLDILDLACGNGLFAYTLAASHPQARVWSADWPSVLLVARRHAERLGVVDRTQFIGGDMFEIDLGGPFDLVLVSHVLHHFPVDRCVALLRRIRAAVRPPSHVVINDYVCEAASPELDPVPYLFSVLMLGWTHGGEAHSLETFRGMLADAGFGAPSVHRISGVSSRVLVAQPELPARECPDMSSVYTVDHHQASGSDGSRIAVPAAPGTSAALAARLLSGR